MDDVHSSQGSYEPISFNSGTIRRSVINHQEADRRGDRQNLRYEAGKIRDLIISRDDYNGRRKRNPLHNSVTLPIAELQPLCRGNQLRFLVKENRLHAFKGVSAAVVLSISACIGKNEGNRKNDLSDHAACHS
jgi:hypothetical protein